jgi:glycogen synthase
VRILVITLRYPPYVAGGYELSCAEAVDELRARGHDLHVLCARGSKFADPSVHAVLEPDLDAGDPWQLAQESGNLEKVRRHVFDPLNLRRARRVMRGWRPDLVFYFNLALLSVAPLMAARLEGLPVVGEINDRWPENHWLSTWPIGSKVNRRRAIEEAWKRTKSRVRFGPMLVPSECLARELRAHGFESVEVLPLPLPVDLAAAAHGLRAAPRQAGEALRVVCTSMLWDGKGQHVLLDAVGRARAEGANVTVTLAGSGPEGYVDHLKSRASSPQLAGAVTFTGLLDRAAVGRLLANSHLFVLPSLWSEPFGLATLEALAHGLPAVVSSAGGSPEIVRDGVDGLVVPSGDAALLAEALVRLERDEVARTRLARAGLERVENAFAACPYYDALSERLERALREARR